MSEGSSTDSGGRSMKTILAWVAGVSAVLGLVTTIYHLYTPIRDQFTGSAETKAAISEAQSLYDHGDYAAAFDSYTELLKKQPRNKAAATGQLEAAMARVRNYSISGAAGDQSIPTRAANELTGLIRVLEPAASKTNGAQASEVTAHLGWARWLRFRIGQSDVFEGAEPYLRKAVTLDRTNVYANAMLGNWLLQAHRGTVQEAAAYLRTAIDGSNPGNRAWARQFQLGALIHEDEPGAHRELARIANEMRKNGEPLDNGAKHNLLNIFAPDTLKLEELDEALSAAPPQEMSATYDWLANGGDTSDAEWKQLKGQFNKATLEELAGQQEKALALYAEMDRHSVLAQTALAAPTKSAIARLKKNAK